MTLLSEIRNLIGRKREPLDLDAADVRADELAGHDEAGGEDLADVEFETKPPLSVLRVDDEAVAPQRDDVLDRLTGMDSRIEARSAATERLVAQLDERLATHATETKRVVEQLDERLATHAAETKRVVEQLDERIGTQLAESRRLLQQVLERLEAEAGSVHKIEQKTGARLEAQLAESKQLAEQVARVPALAAELSTVKQQGEQLLALVSRQADGPDEREQIVKAAVDASAQRFASATAGQSEALDGIRQQLAETSQSARSANEKSESLVGGMQRLGEMTSGLSQSVARITQAGEQREAVTAQLFARSKRSMTLFTFACALASLLAVLVAVVAIFVA